MLPSLASDRPGVSLGKIIINPSSSRSSRLVVSSSANNASPAYSSDASQPTSNRRQLLASGIAAASLFIPALSTGLPAAIAASGPRPLTPEERQAVNNAFASILPKSRAPVMLRLVFHDAGTFDLAANNGGANASIQYELDRPENTGLKRGLGFLEQIITKLKGTPAEGLSKADLIALAGAHAVKTTGGPTIDVSVGRIDAQGPDPENRLPAETLSAAQQIEMFGAKGFSAQEMVALLGSHTLGTKGFGDPVTFDNEYYRSLLKKPWENKSDSMASMIGLASDHVIPDDPTCRPIVQRYAEDENLFKKDFAAAYVKLTTLGCRWR